jgi:hypothetical protein
MDVIGKESRPLAEHSPKPIPIGPDPDSIARAVK